MMSAMNEELPHKPENRTIDKVNVKKIFKVLLGLTFIFNVWKWEASEAMFGTKTEVFV